MRAKTFKLDDLVWRKVVQASKKTKFKPNLEGPFRVVRIVGEEAYILEDMDGKVPTNPWNAQNLNKAYMRRSRKECLGFGQTIFLLSISATASYISCFVSASTIIYHCTSDFRSDEFISNCT